MNWNIASTIASESNPELMLMTKRFEAKTVALLTLPALALLGLASILSFRAQFQRVPRIVTNEVVQVPNTNVLMHRIVVTKNESPWWSQKILGGRDFGVVIQSSKCDQLRILGSNNSEDRNFLIGETLFDTTQVSGKNWFNVSQPSKKAVFRSMLTWKKSAFSSKRDQEVLVRKTISSQDFTFQKIITDDLK